MLFIPTNVSNCNRGNEGSIYLARSAQNRIAQASEERISRIQAYNMSNDNSFPVNRRYREVHKLLQARYSVGTYDADEDLFLVLRE